MANKHSMDLTTGPVFKRLLAFALPLCISNLLQQLYHSADVIVVGKFAENATASLAAVGSTGQITNLLLLMFVGLSVGANVICANRVGSRDEEGFRRVIHTAMPLAFLSGLLLSVVGYFATPTLLRWMGSPEDVIGQATVYMQIIFLGQPGSLVYNFGSGIIRARGDTKRPMYILVCTGLVNVLLNLVFVIVFKMEAAGVALATIIAHYLSAIAILYVLFRKDGVYHMELSELRLDLSETVGIARVGIPSGLNGMVYSISNVIIVSTVNSLGSLSVAATSASTSVSAIGHVVPAAIATACVSFVGQNYGAKNFKRIERVLWCGVAMGAAFMTVVSLAFTLFPEFFLGLYTDDERIIWEGYPKLLMNNWGFILDTVNTVSTCCLRGMRYSSGPAVLNMAFVCGTRLIWTILVFPHLPQTLGYLCIAYPVSWGLSAIAMLIYFYRVKKIEERKLSSPEESGGLAGE